MHTDRPIMRKPQGFTITELSIALSVIAVFLLLAQSAILTRIEKHRLKGQVEDFVSTLRMAAVSAAESNRRYEVIVDPVERTYMLRQITTSQLDEVLDEEIVSEGQFGRGCRVDYIEFDDGDMTTQNRAKFRAGHQGWQYGGKIVLMDEDEHRFTVVVNRLNRSIEIHEGDVGMLTPKAPEDLPFPDSLVGQR